ADRSSSPGFDDASCVGVKARGPFAAEAVGDLAVDGAGAQRAFGAVVGGAERPVGDEHEQVAAGLVDDLDHLAPGVAVRGPGQDAAEPADQLDPMGLELGLVQFTSSPADGAGAFEQAPEGGSDD